MPEDPKTIRRITRFEKYQENALNQRYYAVQRFDLLVIAIASGGIALALNMLKLYVEHPETYSSSGHVLLKIASGLCAVCIISNLLSQISAQKAYKSQSFLGQQKLFELEEDPRFDQDATQKLNEQMTRQHQTTKRYNGISIAFLFTGLIVLAVTIIAFA